MAAIKEFQGESGVSYKVYWDLPRGLVPAGQKRAKGSLTVYDKAQAALAKRYAEEAKHAISGDEVANKIEAALAPKVKGLTVADWAREFMSAKQSEIRTRTWKNYRSQLDDVILPELGDVVLLELTGMHIKNFLDKIKAERKISYRTCDRYFALIKHMLEVAVNNGKAPLNVARTAQWKLNKQDEYSGEDEHAERYFEREQYELLLAQFRPDFRLFVQFLCETGARFSEVTSLRVRDLDFDQNSAWIRTVLNDEGGYDLPKSGKKREIEVRRALMLNVKAVATGKGRDDLVFSSSRGKSINNSNFRRDHWDPAMIKLRQCPRHLPERVDGRNGLSVYDPHTPSNCDCLNDRTWTVFTPHALRHTYATWMLRNGRSITLVSKQLGHSSTKVTENVYAHLERWWKHDIEARLSSTLDEMFAREREVPFAV